MDDDRSKRRRAIGLWCVCLGVFFPVAESAHAKAGARELEVEVWPDKSTCRIELSFAPGLQGLVAARRPGLLEVAALELLRGEEGFEVSWDGVWLTLGLDHDCRHGVTRALSLWKHAAALRTPSRLALPALSPPATLALRADTALNRAVALALGAGETAAPDQALLELLIDALADADGRLVVTGPVSPSQRKRLPGRVQVHHDGSSPEAADDPTPHRRHKVADTPELKPGTLALAPGPDGTTRFWVLWRVGREGAVLATLLGHPGHRLAERLALDMGLVHTLSATFLEGPSLLVVSGSLPGPGSGAALERLFIEIQTLASSLHDSPADEVRALWGAAILTQKARYGSMPARAVEKVLFELTRERATLVVEPGRDDLETQVTLIDSALIAQWIAATLDLRCPSPDETRDRNTLLSEKHGLEARRYLAISRALGRDTERMRQLDHELVDRCEEDKKLRRLLPASSIIALHKEVVCGGSGPGSTRVAQNPDDPAEVTRRKGIFKKYRIDSSAYRPLLNMARRSPVLASTLAATAERCPEAP